MRHVTKSITLLLTVLATGCASEAPTALDAMMHDPVATTPSASDSENFAPTVGTQGHAIPQEMLFDATGNLVGEVHVTVTAGWLNSPHSVYTTIVSVDGQPNHDHGTQLDALSDLEIVDGTLGQGSVDLIIPWTTDSEPKRLDDLYTVCSNVVFGENHQGPIGCTDFGPF